MVGNNSFAVQYTPKEPPQWFYILMGAIIVMVVLVMGLMR